MASGKGIANDRPMPSDQRSECCDNRLPELYPLKRMHQLLQNDRDEFKRVRQEYKELRRLEAAHSLFNFHLKHRLKLMDEYTRKLYESYAALKDDYSLQKACLPEKLN